MRERIVFIRADGARETYPRYKMRITMRIRVVTGSGKKFTFISDVTYVSYDYRNTYE